MKSRRSGVVLILFGVIVALLVAAMVFSVTREATAQTKVDNVDVVFATREIPERTLIPADSLATKRVAADTVPAGAVGTISRAANQMTTTKIYPGEMILSAKLADTKGQSGIAYTLEANKVLITFPASDIIGTGALHVGDTVDILVTYRSPTSGPGQAAPTDTLPPTTQTMMQNLKIVSIGSPAAAAKAGPGVQVAGGNLMTFALDHDDALLLKALKDNDGMVLEVVLRAAGDGEVVKTTPVTMRTIIERYRLRAP